MKYFFLLFVIIVVSLNAAYSQETRAAEGEVYLKLSRTATLGSEAKPSLQIRDRDGVLVDLSSEKRLYEVVLKKNDREFILGEVSVVAPRIPVDGINPPIAILDFAINDNQIIYLYQVSRAYQVADVRLDLNGKVSSRETQSLAASFRSKRKAKIAVDKNNSFSIEFDKGSKESVVFQRDASGKFVKKERQTQP